MKNIAIILGVIALLGTILAPVLFMVDKMGQGPMQLTMLIACLVWFATAPVWMRAK